MTVVIGVRAADMGLLLADGRSSGEVRNLLGETNLTTIADNKRKTLFVESPKRYGRVEYGLFGFSGSTSAIDRVRRAIRTEFRRNPLAHDGKIEHNIHSIIVYALGEEKIVELAQREAMTTTEVKRLLDTGWNYSKQADNLKKELFEYVNAVWKSPQGNVSAVAITHLMGLDINGFEWFGIAGQSYGSFPESQCIGSGSLAARAVLQDSSRFNGKRYHEFLGRDCYRPLLEAFLAAHTEPTVGGTPELAKAHHDGVRYVNPGSVRLGMLLIRAWQNRTIKKRVVDSALVDLIEKEKPYRTVLQGLYGSEGAENFFVNLLSFEQTQKRR